MRQFVFIKKEIRQRKETKQKDSTNLAEPGEDPNGRV